MPTLSVDSRHSALRHRRNNRRVSSQQILGQHSQPISRSPIDALRRQQRQQIEAIPGPRIGNVTGIDGIESAQQIRQVAVIPDDECVVTGCAHLTSELRLLTPFVMMVQMDTESSSDRSSGVQAPVTVIVVSCGSGVHPSGSNPGIIRAAGVIHPHRQRPGATPTTRRESVSTRLSVLIHAE